MKTFRPTRSIRWMIGRVVGFLACSFIQRKGGLIYKAQTAQSPIQSGTAANPNTITSRLLEAESSYKRGQPKYSNRNIRWNAEPQVVPPLYLHSIPNACVGNLGVISTFDGRIVAESAEQFLSKKQKLDGFVELHENNFIHEKVPETHVFSGLHLLLKNKHAENYGHFILECLPNIRLLHEFSELNEVKVVIPKTDKPGIRKFFFDALAIAGVNENQVVELGGHGVMGVFEELLYPSPLTHHPIWKSRISVTYCEQLALRVGPSEEAGGVRSAPPRYLYVSRSAGFKRRPTNEPAVIDLLVNAGFEVVYPEEMSFQQQIALFSRAEVVVGILGAAMTNTVFSPRTTQIIMLTPDSISGHFFWDLASLKGQGYYALFCQTIKQERGYGDADFYVDINRLKEALSLALESAKS